MKAKSILTVCCLILAIFGTQAQQTNKERERAIVETKGDSIIILKGKEEMHIKIYERQGEGNQQKEVEIYEGIYLEKVDADSRTFLDVLPFIPKKKYTNTYKPHISGIFIGFSRMADNFMGFGSSPKAHLDLMTSWEFGFNILASSYNFKKNPHWGINAGINWGYRSFSISDNYALLKENGASIYRNGQEMAPEGCDPNLYYSNSRLRHFFFRIPIQIEWQQRSKKKLLFFNIGPEIEIRHGVKSFTNINGGKKQTLGKGMYVQPVGSNLLLQGGFGKVGIYLRYSMTCMFEKDKGPGVSPYSFGLAWYW